MGEMIKFSEMVIKGPRIVHLSSFADERGSFARLFCKKQFSLIVPDRNVVQINHSYTKNKGTVRGMHYQTPPFAETKIIKCIKGKVFDILVDIRKNSDTFLSWFGLELSDTNNTMIVIPEGFAHGFQTLEDNTELIYFHTSFYNPQAEAGLRFDDPKLNINWKLTPKNISNRDNNFNFLNDTFKGIEI